MEVNYKNKKHYKTAKYPIRQPWYLMLLIWVLSKIMLIGKKYRVEKIDMEGLKPPYILLSNHMSFIDFELVAMGTFPYRVNNVVNIDGFYRRAWLLEWIGAICTRKFTTDLHLVKSIRRVLQRGDILCMYPEARYAPAGVLSYLPPSLGYLVKRCGVPVVVAVHRGNYLHSPFWNFRKKRKVPLHTTLTKILTLDEIQTMTPEQIHERIASAMNYDEYRYQKDNGIEITEPYRAEGLHKILYQCPHCLAESKMDSKGTELFCTECGRRWELLTDGTLRATEGETRFTHVPDWFAWEREQVKAEIARGEYRFEDEVEVYSLPRCRRFERLGQARLIHTVEDGFVLETDSEPCFGRMVFNCAGLSADKVQELAFEPSVRLELDGAEYLVFDTLAPKPEHIIFLQAASCGKGITAIPCTEGNLLISGVRKPMGVPFATTVEGLRTLHEDTKELLPESDLSKVIRSFGAVRPNPYVANGESLHDFCIGNPAPGFYSLIGIKTPGLTASNELGLLLAEKAAAYLGAEKNSDFDPKRKAISEMDNEIVCQCGQITRAEIIEAIRRGASTVDGVKRRAGSGMGRCQGSRCAYAIEKLLEEYGHGAL